MSGNIDALNELFREILSDSAVQIWPEMTAHDHSAWDSLNHINIVISIESEFNIQFTTAEIAGMRNVGDLVSIMRQVKGVDIDWAE